MIKEEKTQIKCVFFLLITFTDMGLMKMYLVLQANSLIQLAEHKSFMEQLRNNCFTLITVHGLTFEEGRGEEGELPFPFSMGAPLLIPYKHMELGKSSDKI